MKQVAQSLRPLAPGLATAPMVCTDHLDSDVFSFGTPALEPAAGGLYHDYSASVGDSGTAEL